MARLLLNWISVVEPHAWDVQSPTNITHPQRVSGFTISQCIAYLLEAAIKRGNVVLIRTMHVFIRQIVANKLKY